MIRSADSTAAIRALSAPIFVIGLEWIVSGMNKIIGNFVATFPSYASSLQSSHIFLPGLSLMVHFPVVAAYIAIVTETGLGITLVLTSFFFLRRATRIWELVGSTALALSAVVSGGLWLIVGRPAFWPDGNGYGSGWPIEFFLISISAALALAVAVADHDVTLIARLGRLLRRRTDYNS